MPASALTEPTQPTQMPGLPQLIMEVAEPVWKKIGAALQVKTRQEAVQLVQADEQAAAVVTQIIQSSSALTRGAKAPSPSALTAPSAQAPFGERLYGGGGKARLQIG